MQRIRPTGHGRAGRAPSAAHALAALLLVGTLTGGIARAQPEGADGSTPPKAAAGSETPPGSAPPQGEADPASDAPPPPPAADGGWSAQSEADARLAEAREHVTRGEQLFDQGNHDAALAEFETAYALLDGHPAQPQLLFNIGLCHERAFRYTRAMAAYRRYLEEAGESATDRPRVEATVAALEGLLATLLIETNTAAEVWVDDRLVGEAPGAVLVPGGHHSLELRAAGYESHKQEIQVPARRELEVHVDLGELSRDEGLPRVYFWSGVGATAVALAVGSGYAISALKDSKSAKGNTGDLVYLNGLPTQEAIEDKQLKADICFAVAGGFAVATGILAIFTDWGREAADAGETGGVRATLRIAPVVGPGGAGAGVWGRF